MFNISHPLPVSQECSSQEPHQKPKLQPSLQFKIPDLEFASPQDSSINFQTESCKLVQANTIMTYLIKETTLEKYLLSEKIHTVMEQIKKLETKNIK